MYPFFAFTLFFLFASPLFSQEEITVKKYPNGKPSLVWVMKEKNGEKEKIKEISYFENGQREYEGSYQKGLEHGIWTYWYRNGTKKYQEYYSKGDEQGTHFEWDKNGKLIKEEIYRNGKLIETKVY